MEWLGLNTVCIWLIGNYCWPKWWCHYVCTVTVIGVPGILCPHQYLVVSFFLARVLLASVSVSWAVWTVCIAAWHIRDSTTVTMGLPLNLSYFLDIEIHRLLEDWHFLNAPNIFNLHHYMNKGYIQRNMYFKLLQLFCVFGR